MSASTNAMSTSSKKKEGGSGQPYHVIRDDDGEYFSEDPTLGIDSKEDPNAAATMKSWGSIAPVTVASEEMMQLVKRHLQNSSTTK